MFWHKHSIPYLIGESMQNKSERYEMAYPMVFKYFINFKQNL